MARVEALRSSGFCCPRLLCYVMASSDFPRGVAIHFVLRLIGLLTATEYQPTTWDLDRSLTLPSVHAVARNTGDDDCFSSLRIHSRCCLRPYTGGSTIPFPNSPSNTRSRCHDGAIHSLSVRPERLPVPPDWVLRLRVGSAATWQITPPCLTPGYRAHRDLPGRGPFTPLVRAGLGPRYDFYTFAPASRRRTPR